jgi:diacylglycerol kinase (ATP)
MKRSVIFHNPNAGDSDHLPEDLVRMIKKQGYTCRYVSIKSEGWQNFDEKVDFLIAGGGDGCVRRVVEMLLHRTLMQPRFPLAILPLGTANNFSKTLGIKTDLESAISSLKSAVSRKLDVGFLNGLTKHRAFFIEGTGLGVFPALMKKMKSQSISGLSTTEKIHHTLLVLEQIIEEFEPVPVVINADGIRYEGEFLMVEVLNTKSIGPNLLLASQADPGDGHLELVLVHEQNRRELLDYIRGEIAGTPGIFSCASQPVRTVKMLLPSTALHVDDQYVEFSGGKVNISLNTGILDLLTPPMDVLEGTPGAYQPRDMEKIRG